MSERAGLPFGDQLRELRETQGLTQEELAERSGVSKETISLIERGQVRRPHADTVARLADALGITGEARGGFGPQARRAMSRPSTHTPHHRAASSADRAAEHIPSARTTHRRSAALVRYQILTLAALLVLMLASVALLRQPRRENRDQLRTASAVVAPTLAKVKATPGSTPDPSPVIAAEPTATGPPGPPPTVPIVATDIRTPTLTPAVVSAVFVRQVRVPGDSNSGAQVRVKQSGRYTFRYLRGAYSTYRRAPASAATWSTTVVVFLGDRGKWGGNDQRLQAELALVQVGSGSFWHTAEEAERAGKGASAQVQLDAGDVLTFVAVDQNTRYFDNRGEVRLEIVLEAD